MNTCVRRRWLRSGFAVSMLALAAVFATAAWATAPSKTTSSVSGNSEDTSLCGVPIAVNFTATIVRTAFFDENGNLTMVHLNVIEQATFSANGKTLVSAPYPYNVHIYFDEGGFISRRVVDGVFLRVPLPDGSTFVAAGQGAAGVYAVDHGTNGNRAAFCAALS